MVAGCDKKKDKPVDHAATVEAAVVQSTNLPMVIEGTGTIAAWQEAPIGAEVGGLTAVKLMVDEGQSVKVGDPLIQMNDVLLKAQFRQAEAQAHQAQRSYDRAKDLFDKGYFSQAALDNATSARETTQAALQTAQTQLNSATIRAPISGIITSRKAVLGQIVQPGAELFRIVRDGRIELNMEVVESKLALLHPGQNVTVRSEAGNAVAGTVRIVTPSVDPSSRLGTARISIPWSSGLRPGMFASASIETGTANAMMIPQKAIIYNQNKPAVFRVGDDGRAHKTTVTLGQAPGDSIVVADGLAVGDRVITTGAGFLVDNDKVTFTHAASGEGH